MAEQYTCVHCGADCGKHPILENDKPFCCNGCLTVYKLLGEKQLYTYYQIEPTPGIKADIKDAGTKYAYLDNADIIEKLIEFKEGDYVRVQFYIPAIHCSSCIWLLENLHYLDSGILQSTVNFTRKKLSISFKQSEISLRKVVELLVSIHYIPQITLETIDEKAATTSSRKLLYKIGYSGFAFGNTMLLSMPDYLSGPDTIDPALQTFFGYLNLLLAIPVLLYSSSDYLLSGWKNLRKGIMNIDVPIALGIVTIFTESAYEIISGNGTGYMDSLAGLLFFLLIGKWYQARTYKALSFERDYRSYFPIAVTRLQNGKEESIPLDEIQPGNVLLIRHEELIPADSVLKQGEARIDYSFVTGESTPISKEPGQVLYAGGKQTSGAILIEVQKEVRQSRLTQLWNESNTKADDARSLNKIMDKVSRNFTYFVLFVSISSGIFWLIYDKSLALYAFTSVLIVACPCALALAIPFAFGNTMRRFGRMGFYIKSSDVVEHLRNADTLVFDKTGTITHAGAAELKYTGTTLTPVEYALVKASARQSTHPVSQILEKSIQIEMDLPEITEFEEITGKGTIARSGNVAVRIGSASWLNVEKDTAMSVNSTVHIEINGVYKGYFTITNQYRQGLKPLIEKLKKQYELHVISGDNESERENLRAIFGSEAQLHFHQAPEDKLQYIKKLTAEGKRPIMIGDGLNDAGALTASYVGITIAEDVYHFSPACDAILESGRLSQLAEFIAYSKKSYRIVLYSFALSFLYNLVGLSFAVQGLLSPIIAAILMPASSVSVVAFVTLGTNWVVKLKAKPQPAS